MRLVCLRVWRPPSSTLFPYTTLFRSYQPSPRLYPDVLPPIEYGPEDIVRKVQAEGLISYQNRTFRLSKAFRSLPVALRPTPEDGILEVFFCHQKVARIDLHQPNG